MPRNYEHRDKDQYSKPCCYFHPKEVLEGVCPLCLNEKLLILAAKNGHLPKTRVGSHRAQSTINGSSKPPTSAFPYKIFALGSILNRFEFLHKQDNNSIHTDASTSPEDSFISIKFGDNGVASWEKNATVSKVSLDHCNKMSWNSHSCLSKEVKKGDESSIVEHMKPHAPLRWRKRIGHLFQLVRWKRSNKADLCHVGREGVKIRSGWIRTLTKRRPKE